MKVFVTGASVGFGAAIARRFAKEGAHVVLCSRRAEKLQQLAHELGPKAMVCALDVRDRDAVGRAVEDLPAAFRDLDVLVNNAGLALGTEPAQRAVLDDWERMVDTNIKGLMYCTRAILPGMVARNRGHIINIGSTAGAYPYPGGNCYGGTKAFVHQFSLNLRADLLGTAVRVTSIEPGLGGGTEFSEVRYHGDKARAAKVYDNTQPLTADDVADTAWWVTHRPPHVNIDYVSILPTCQACGPYAVHRGPLGG
ncbi:MAG TPA: SDR family oxidoreductase [Nevskiaceae bacterium]|nr:SDR family oxidoreductase [Nevskiaceae bacterium]